VLLDQHGLTLAMHLAQRVQHALALSQPLVRLLLIQCVHQPLHLALLDQHGLTLAMYPVQLVQHAQVLSQRLAQPLQTLCVHQPLHLVLLALHGPTLAIHLAQRVQHAQVQTALLHLLALQPQIPFVDLLQVQLPALLDNMSPDLHALGVLLERIKIHHPLQALLAHLALLVHLA
jgi:hypothetical protein